MGEEVAKAEEVLTERLQLIREIVDNPIPSILTVSLREVLDYYHKKIVRLQAEGGEYPTRSVVLDDNYGVTFVPGSSGTIKMDYTQSRAPDGTILNPINEEWIQKMHGYLNKNLPEHEGHPPDIPVTLLLVEIEDTRIAELAGTETNVFDATFNAEWMEPQIKSKVHSPASDYYDAELAEHWRVLLGQGFRMRNLNLMLLLERTQKFAEPKKVWKPIIQWGGYTKQDLNPKSPIEVAGRIRDTHLAPKFRLLKTYRVMRGNKLVLDGFR